MSDERRLSRKRTIHQVQAFTPAFAAFSLATAVRAEELNRVSVTVSYADLDVTTDAGAATLHGRIDAGVKEVCSRPSLRELKAVAAWQKCRTDALQSAADRIAEAHVPVRFIALSH